jgi:hypothetical protein
VFRVPSAFEIASVKPGQSYRGVSPSMLAVEATGLRRQMSSAQDSQFKADSPLHLPIQAADDTSGLQVEGGPSWVRDDRPRRTTLRELIIKKDSVHQSR